jgi:AraC-like DNA-binding protein
MMPKKDGHQVCAALKHDERTSHIPIILLTAKADIESRIEGLETKADDYLTKPFVARELLLRIKNLIDSRRQLRDKYVRSMTLKPAEVPIKSLDEKFLRKLMEEIEHNIGDESFSVEVLGSAIGMSRSQLHRKLKALIGQGPNQFIRSFRLNRAHDMLKANSATAAEIAYSVGFSSPSYFTKCFHEQFGYTPSEIGSKSSSV